MAAALRRVQRYLEKSGFAAFWICPDGDAYLRTWDGLWLWYNLNQPGLVAGDGQSLDVQAHQTIEPSESLLFSLMDEGMTYLDVGANIGYYFLLKLAQKFEHLRLIGFEPNPVILVHLEKNLAVNGAAGRVLIERLALSDSAGGGHLQADRSANSFLRPDHQAVQGTVAVAVDTLDGYVQRTGLDRIDIIKVDIEGGEFSFLKGATETLKKLRPLVLMELDDRLLSNAGADTRQVNSWLRDLSYDLFRVAHTRDALAIPSERQDDILKRAERRLEFITFNRKGTERRHGLTS